MAGWENLDKSPNVLLSKVPLIRRVLERGRLISASQAQGFPPGVKFSDLSKSLPYDDGSVQFIYSGHLIEHISPSQAAGLLSECRRVIAPGGVIRFSTPDLREFVDAYLAEKSESFEDGRKAADLFMARMGTFVEADGGWVRRFVNRNVSAFHHQWLYDEDSLAQIFRTAGFSDPVLRRYHEGAMPDLDALEIRPEGLFIEAVA